VTPTPVRRRAVLGAVLAAAAAAPLVLPSRLPAHSYRAGRVLIGHPWALPSDGPDGEAFLSLLNAGGEADRLLAARTPAARTVEAVFPGGGFPLDLPPGRPIAMRPGGPRLRLAGLVRPLALGDAAPLVLVFERAGEAETSVLVETSPGH
jgi:copper(I)-binding protein